MANINFTDLINKPVTSDDPEVVLRSDDEQAQLDQQYIFTGEGLAALGAVTLTNAIGPTDSAGQTWVAEQGPKYITLQKGNGAQLHIQVGSDIVFKDGETSVLPLTILEGANDFAEQNTGTFRVVVDGETYEVPINGLAGNSSGQITLNGNTTVNGNITLPSLDTKIFFGNNGYSIQGTTSYGGGLLTHNLIPDSNTYSLGYEWDTNRYWKNLFLSNRFYNEGTNDGIKTTDKTNPNPDTSTNDWSDTNASGDWTGSITRVGSNASASIFTKGGICAQKNIWARRVFNAVFNDYAEYRTTISLTPGHVVIDQDDGSLACSTARLQPGAQVISDTFGHSMGATDKATTPIAVAGRALVYPYKPREHYHAGMAVCSAPNGTVDIMTRDEIRDYPDCIVGIVSEIPQYETWGSDNVKVDGRIWVRIK